MRKKTPSRDRGAIVCRAKTLALTLLVTLVALALSTLALTTLLAALSRLLLLLTRLLLAAALLAALATLTAALVLLVTLILLARLLFVGVHICSFSSLREVTTRALRLSSSLKLRLDSFRIALASGCLLALPELNFLRGRLCAEPLNER